jgi:hypothetical protein
MGQPLLLIPMVVLPLTSCAKVEIRNVIEDAEESIFLRWESPKDPRIRIELDRDHLYLDGKPSIHVVRQELPIYHVKNALVKQTTVTRRFDPLPPGGENVGAGVVLIAGLVILYPVMSITGFPDSWYVRPGRTETQTVFLPEGEAIYDDPRWVSVPRAKVWVMVNDRNAGPIYCDETGTAQIDLPSLLRQYQPQQGPLDLVLRLKRKGPDSTRLSLQREEVERLRAFP